MSARMHGKLYNKRCCQPRNTRKHSHTHTHTNTHTHTHSLSLSTSLSQPLNMHTPPRFFLISYLAGASLMEAGSAAMQFMRLVKLWCFSHSAALRTRWSKMSKYP